MFNIRLNLVTGDIGKIGTIDFSKIIGQELVKEKLKFYLHSHCQASPLPTLLFSGSHGLGKTYTAKILAENMGRRFVEVNCEMIQTTKDFVESVLFERVLGDSPVTILLDEAHRLSKEVSTALLSMLAPSKNSINLFHYKNVPISYDMSKINVIMATTDAFRIFKPLLNRCEKIYFDHYPPNELFRILEFYLTDTDIRGCSVEELSWACRGRARDAFFLADKIKRMCQINGTRILTPDGWNNLKKIFDIFHMGLNRQEVELMMIIRDNEPISCHNIAMLMMLNEENVEGEIEVRPRELGLITNITQGRILSEDGKKYCESIESFT